MLHDFLLKEEDYIIQKYNQEAKNLAGSKKIWPDPTGSKAFWDQLVELLKLENITIVLDETNGGLKKEDDAAEEKREETSKASTESILKLNAQKRGQEFRKLGYTLSEVVHSYGNMCQAITTSANDLNYSITSREFSQLNLSLDVAIALSVTEYDRVQTQQGNQTNTERIGALAHELRNALQSAFIALELIQTGSVGTQSQTGKMLDRSLQSMKMLIDSALLMVRLNSGPTPHLEWLPILSIASDVEVTAAIEARKNVVSFKVDIDANLSAFADRQHFTSALSNLTQNAVKFLIPVLK